MSVTLRLRNSALGEFVLDASSSFTNVLGAGDHVTVLEHLKVANWSSLWSLLLLKVL